MPTIYHAIKTRHPQLHLRNIPVHDAETQLSQFQSDLIIDNHIYSNRAVENHVLFSDKIELVCRQNHPFLTSFLTPEALNGAEHTLLMIEGQSFTLLRQRIRELFPRPANQL